MRCRACTKRKPHAEFAHTTRCSHHEKIGDVRAGEKQHQAHSSKKDEKNRPHRSYRLVQQRHGGRAPSRIHMHLLARSLSGEGRHLSTSSTGLTPGRRRAMTE